MICPKCGKENRDGVNFCGGCGEKLTQAETTPAEKTERRSKKKLLLICIAAVLVLALAGGAYVVFSRQSENPMGEWWDFAILEDVFGKEVAVHGMQYLGEMGDYVGIQASADNSTILLRDSNQGLRLIRKGTETAVFARDSEYEELSVEGNVVVYIREAEGADPLYLYDVASGTHTWIDEDVDRVTVSPNGKYIAYVKDRNSAYLYCDGHSSLISHERLKLLSVSNDGECVYAVNSDDHVCCFHKDGPPVRLQKDCDAGSGWVLNRDHSQIMFFTDSGAAYLCRDGMNAVPVFKEYEVTDAFMMQPMQWYGLRRTCMVDDLTDQLYTVYGLSYMRDCIYLREDLQEVKLGIEVRSMNGAEKILYGVNEDHAICRTDLKTGEQQVLQELDPDTVIWGVYPLEDGTVYYMDYDDEKNDLFRCGNAEPIAKDIDSAFISGESNLFFTTRDEDEHDSLWIVEGDQPVLIRENVSNIVQSDYVYYTVQTQDVIEVYASEGGKDFRMIGQEVDDRTDEERRAMEALEKLAKAMN